MIKLAFDLVECCLEFTNPLTYGCIVTAHTQTEPHPMLLNDAQAQALYKAIQALNEGGGQLLTASFDAFALGEAIIDVYTHTDDRIELRSAGNVTEVHDDLSAFVSAYRLQAL